MLTFEVKGYTGGAVVIKCKYEDKYQWNKKYFCRDTASNSKSCKDQIKTHLKNQWVNDGRFSLYDNTTGTFFMVIFRDLTPKDAGKYCCAVDRFWSKDSYKELDLNINEGENCKNVKVQACFKCEVFL